MPANLFVVIFPRTVKAETVYVTRKEKPKSKWSVSGLRSPPGVFSAREGRGSRSDERQASVSHLSRHLTNAAMTSSNTSGSGASSNDRAASGTSAHNELKNQKTVRIQLSRPTDEVEPTPTPGDMLAASTSTGIGIQRGSAANANANANAIANAWGPTAAVEGSNFGNRRRSQSWNYADNQLATSRRQSLVGSTGDVGSSSGAEGGGGAVASTSGCSASTASASQSGAARSSRCSSSSVPGMFNGSSDLLSRFTSDPGFGGRGSDSGIPPGPGMGRGLEGFRECKDAAAGGGGHGDAGAGLADAGEARRHSHGQFSGAKSQLLSERRAVEERGAVAGSEWASLASGLGGADARDNAAGGVVAGGAGGGVGSPSLKEAKDMGDLGKMTLQAPDDQEAGKRNLEVIEVLGDDGGVGVLKAEDVDETAVHHDIEHYVRSVLQDIRTHGLLIGEPTYHLSAGGKLMTCIFPCDGEDSHLVLTKLESVGVGSEVGSVNVLPMEIGRSDITRRKQRENTERERARTARRKRRRFSSTRDADVESREGASVAFGGGLKGNADASSKAAGAGGEEVGANPNNPLSSSQSEQREDESKRTYAKFRALASQIRVAQVTEEIRDGTKFHFDYMALLIASSTISAIGLADDNVAVVVAAMLVSPIMGPVLAFTFGTNVRDWSLAKQGFTVESISLLICVAVGFVTGVVGVLSTKNNHWPTEQMSSRGEYWGLLVGLIIAIPSGMAVALSILSKNVNSLVGVAISASLLPPAVNTGLCLAIALLGSIFADINVDGMDFVRIGLVSMCLTIVNIFGIYVAGVCLFLFKEVAPIKLENSFWSKDMIAARKFQSMLSKYGVEGGEAAHNLMKRLYEEARLPLSGKEADADGGNRGEPFNYERKGSFSSNTNTHHRYRHKDRRRRTTVFELFGDAFADEDVDTALEADGHQDGAQEQSSQSARPDSGGFMGLVANRIRSARPFGRSEDGNVSSEEPP